MRNCLRISMLLFFLSFGFVSYAAQDNAAGLKAAPGFQLKDLNGRTVSLSDYKDKKAVILFFWTTWCPYCREELRLLNREYVELAKDSIEVLAINAGEPKYKVGNYLQARNLSLEVLLDTEGFVAQAYDIMGVPTYFMVNKSGEIVSTANRFPKEAVKALAAK
ncbi:MAG: TlpA disulfide reductase family protein [Candidatus Omnitrophota bacterium]